MANMRSTKQVDNTTIDVPRLARAVLFITAIFLLVMLGIFLAGRLPPTPNIATPYSTEVWDRISVEQRELLATYGVITPEMEGVEEEEDTGETRYHIPIEEAKALIVEQGLPVVEGADAAGGE